MNVHPNETSVRAVVKRIEPCADGYGHELRLEIISNESADPDADYLKPKAGDELKAFTADLGDLQNGSRISAKLGLSAGPFGQRTILRGAEPDAVKP